jgi:hypothetical protein
MKISSAKRRLLDDDSSSSVASDEDLDFDDRVFSGLVDGRCSLPVAPVGSVPSPLRSVVVVNSSCAMSLLLRMDERIC